MTTNNRSINRAVSATTIKGPSDYGYVWSGLTRKMDDVARLAPVHFPGILSDTTPKELIAEFKKGALLRYAEAHPPVAMVKEGSDYRAAKSGEKATVTLSVAYARGFAAHEVTKLKNSDKALHALVKATRDAAGKDISQQWLRLVSRAKALLVEKDSTPRVAKSWTEKMGDAFEELISDAGKRREKALDAPNEDAIRKATVAFWVTLKKEAAPKGE